MRGRRRRRRREKRASPQVLEQCVEVQFACLLGLISGKEERSWQDFKTQVRKKGCSSDQRGKEEFEIEVHR
jgi:hypothetical protein